MAEVIKVTSKGQVTLPADIRKKLHISKDTYIAVDIIGDYIIMKKVKLAFLLILSLVLVLLVAQNTAPVQARFLWLTSEIPVIVLLFLTSAGGFVAGLLVALLLNKDHQSKQ